jgi:formylglycine-generating enzyme required for sulfatase activity
MGQTPEYQISVSSLLSLQRIAIMSPYLLQTTEVTVAAFRASKLAVSGDPDTTCEVYTAQPGLNERAPVNCVSWNKARQFCARRGGDLPTEAQFEYAAGATASRKFVWGDDAPTCADAVYGHTFALGGNIIPGVCNLQGGPRPVGSGIRDRLLLPGADEEIVDLAGNVAEWAVDAWSDTPNGVCWGTGVYTDPVCTTPDDPKAPYRPTRGGSVLEGPFTLRAAHRSRSAAKYTSIGFRCARPDATGP